MYHYTIEMHLNKPNVYEGNSDDNSPVASCK